MNGIMRKWTRRHTNVFRWFYCITFLATTIEVTQLISRVIVETTICVIRKEHFFNDDKINQYSQIFIFRILTCIEYIFCILYDERWSRFLTMWPVAQSIRCTIFHSINWPMIFSLFSPRLIFLEYQYNN